MALKTITEKMTPAEYASRWLVTAAVRQQIERAEGLGLKLEVDVAYTPFGNYALGVEVEEEPEPVEIVAAGAIKDGKKIEAPALRPEERTPDPIKRSGDPLNVARVDLDKARKLLREAYDAMEAVLIDTEKDPLPMPTPLMQEIQAFLDQQ